MKKKDSNRLLRTGNIFLIKCVLYATFFIFAVTNLAGQLLFIQPVGNTRTEVNVRNLAPGTYIAHINTRAGNTDRKFVVGR